MTGDIMEHKFRSDNDVLVISVEVGMILIAESLYTNVGPVCA